MLHHKNLTSAATAFEGVFRLQAPLVLLDFTETSWERGPRRARLSTHLRSWFRWHISNTFTKLHTAQSHGSAVWQPGLEFHVASRATRQLCKRNIQPRANKKETTSSSESCTGEAPCIHAVLLIFPAAHLNGILKQSKEADDRSHYARRQKKSSANCLTQRKSCSWSQTTPMSVQKYLSWAPKTWPCCKTRSSLFTSSSQLSSKHLSSQGQAVCWNKT